MRDVPVENVRNFAMLGHTGSGKTSLIDALLHRMGVNDRKGTPENGTSMADWTEEERERQITMWAKPFEGIHEAPDGTPYRLVLLDTPGYADFVGQMVSAVAVADAGMILIDATAGVQVGSNRAWRRCEAAGIGRAVVISGVDKDNADFDAVLDALRGSWGACCVPMSLPGPRRHGGAGARRRAPRAPRRAGRGGAQRTDRGGGGVRRRDAGEVPGGRDPRRRRSSPPGCAPPWRAGRLVPVFAVSSRTEAGLPELLDGIGRVFPSPRDREVKDAGGAAVDTSPSAPFAGLVWRSIIDPFVGQLSVVRVFGGTLSADSEVQNATREHQRAARRPLRAQRQEAGHGERRPGPATIVAIPKLKMTALNDTLCKAGESVSLPGRSSFPHPVMAYAVTPKTQGDEDKLAHGLHRAAERGPDPARRAQRRDARADPVGHGRRATRGGGGAA